MGVDPYIAITKIVHNIRTPIITKHKIANPSLITDLKVLFDFKSILLFYKIKCGNK